MTIERKTKAYPALAVGFLLLANTTSAQTLSREDKYECLGKLMGAIRYNDSTSAENGKFVKQNQKDIDRIDPPLMRMTTCVKGVESRLPHCRSSLPKNDQHFWDHLMKVADVYERARQQSMMTAQLVLAGFRPEKN